MLEWNDLFTFKTTMSEGEGKQNNYLVLKNHSAITDKDKNYYII